MNRMRLLWCACLLSACATAYHATGFSGGYSEIQLADDVFQISFRGNGYTSSERAADFALLRSAEVALEHGFPYFVVVNDQSSVSRSTFTTPSTTTGSATVIGNTVYGTATTTGGQTYHITKPSTRNTIVGLRVRSEGVLYDANIVIRSVRVKYHLQPRS